MSRDETIARIMELVDEYANAKAVFRIEATPGRKQDYAEARAALFAELLRTALSPAKEDER